MPVLLLVVLAVCGVTFAQWGATEAAQPEAAREGPPRFEDVCFDDFHATDGWPTEERLRELLEPLPNARNRIAKTRDRNGEIYQVSGVWRLKEPWQTGTALRVSIRQPQRVRWHLWHGNSGVTLRYYPEPLRVWAAYGTMREDGKPQPKVVEFLASDQGRYRRTGAGTFELHCHDGQLVVTRGDIRLLTVPMASPPSEVVFEGSAQIRGLEFFPVTGVPAEPSDRKPSRQALVPADQDWEVRVPEGCSLAKLPDGGVELKAAEKTPEGQAAVTICRPGLHEFVFEVEDPRPGTGIFLGDETGKQLARVAFFRDRRGGQTTIGRQRPDRRDLDATYEESKYPVPYVGHRLWVRVVAGAGRVQIFTGVDGLHWSRATPEAERMTGACTQVGLYCLLSDHPRSIRLKRILVGRFDAIHSLVPESLWNRMSLSDHEGAFPEPGSLAKLPNVEEFERQVPLLRPPEVDPDTWRRACLLSVLSEGVRWCSALLPRLIEEGLSEERDPRFHLRFLEEATLLGNSDDYHAVDRLAGHYRRLGREMDYNGTPDAFRLLRRRLVYSPHWSKRELPAMPERALWYDLCSHVAADRWSETARLCRQLRYWGRRRQLDRESPPWSSFAEHLICCVEYRAGRRQLELAPDRPVDPRRNYRHPLIERWSKEGYNVKVELQAALDAAGGNREACRVISSAPRAAMKGVLPDATDPRLLVSLPVMIERVVRDNASLGKTMQEHFGSVAELRLRQATDSGNATAMEALAVRFHGSRAAREAGRWLGDRHLAGGRFAEAAGCYRRALRPTVETDSPDLVARLALARAMQGRPAPALPKAAVEIGQRRIGAAEFERLLDEMRQTHRRPGQEHETADRCPPPGKYGVTPWAIIEGFGTKKPASYSATDVDWAGRETAAVLIGQRMVVTNHSEQYAFDLAGGQKRWYHRRSVSSPGRFWPLVPMPAVAGRDGIFVRRPDSLTAELVRLTPTEGRLSWTGKLKDLVASDALVVGDSVWAFTARRAHGQKTTFHLTRFDAGSGETLRQIEIVGFQAVPPRGGLCQATLVDDKIVATMCGAVLCCDLPGRLRWLRRQAWIAPPGHSAHDSKPWLLQRHRPPLVVGRRVYTMQPGNWSIECLDLDTGRLAWRTTLSGLRGLAGWVAGRVIAETDEGLLGIDPQTGKILWHHESRDRLEACLCGPPGGILYARRQASQDPGRKEPQVVLVWLDPATGAVRDELVLDTPKHAHPLLGPMVSDGRRLWVFAGVADDKARREILELTPVEKK